MKKVAFWVLASLGLIFYVASSFSDPGAKIGKNFRRACQEVNSARKLEISSYTAAFKLYNKAIAKINNITGKYSSSEIALKLFKNQLKVGPYPFLEFKEEIIPRAKLRAEAESNPLACSFYAINLLDTIQFEDKLKVTKAAKLAEISTKFSGKWQFGKAALILNEGNKIVETIYSDSYKVRALVAMAQALETAGKRKKARQLLQQATTIVKTISQSERPDALLKLVSAFCMIGQFKSAEALITQLNTSKRNNAWSIIAQNYAKKGKLRTARKTAENIEDDNLQAETFQVIIAQTAAAGRFEKAEQLVSKINSLNTSWIVKALADIAFHAGKDGKRDLAVSYFEQAIKTANQFESYELTQKLSVLNYIAFRFIELKDKNNAVQILKSNSESAKNLSEFNRAEAFAEIAVAYSQIGEVEKALELISSYVPDYLSINIRGATLAKLALQYADKHQFQKAFDLADQIASETTLPELNRASVMSRIAIHAAEDGYYQTALKIAENINSSFYKPWTLGEIALKLSEKRFYFSKRQEMKKYLHQIIIELNLYPNYDHVTFTILEHQKTGV